ncbi:hypothetical protein [Photorhabdus stackebrandtii]|uniref:Uncharacterized protein n=1 Tax=Photorhabdus stackebrandtii TaxID=1123042 RepID=A0A7X5QQ94_9GAMM|nr:hypothetical protein [Photorhabdus stackebrandtii]NHB98573.1 hypothetical protein [Photorhabdus stackebrandtii]
MSTTFIRIINETSKKIHIVEGEYGRYYAIDRKTTLAVSIPAPWIGNQNEGNKAIAISAEDEEDILLFLDYYSNNDQIKFNRGDTFDYKNAKNVAGRSSGGGSKVLLFEEKEDTSSTIPKFKISFRIL